MAATPSHKTIGVIAENYAQGLFDVALKAGSLEQIVDDIHGIAQLLRDQKDLAALFAHRTIDTPRRDATLRKLFTGKIDNTTLKFLLLLNRKRRLDQLLNISRALDLLSKQHRNEIDVEVISARPLTADQVASVTAKLTSVLKKTAVVHPFTDPTLIGGLKIRIEDRVIDASVASRLRRLARQMSINGVERLRSKPDILETASA